MFDGIRVPLKKDTNDERERRRRVHLAEARRLAAMGRKEEARENYNKCVKGTEEMGRVVCAEVERIFGRGVEAKVKCVFSPYEADAQLAKLCLDGICHAVVTEVCLFAVFCVFVVGFWTELTYFYCIAVSIVDRIQMFLCTLQHAGNLFRVSASS